MKKLFCTIVLLTVCHSHGMDPKPKITLTLSKRGSRLLDGESTSPRPHQDSPRRESPNRPRGNSDGFNNQFLAQENLKMEGNTLRPGSRTANLEKQ